MAFSAKTTQGGGHHECLPLVVDDIKFQHITNDAKATTEHKEKPTATPPGLTNSTTLINRTRLLNTQKVEIKDSYKQESTDTIIVE